MAIINQCPVMRGENGVSRHIQVCGGSTQVFLSEEENSSDPSPQALPSESLQASVLRSLLAFVVVVAPKTDSFSSTWREKLPKSKKFSQRHSSEQAY